jgi:heat shock protein HtpX
VNSTNSSAPHDVYVDGAINAGVLSSGGFLGIRTRRALVLGLPLVKLITAGELRAVLAHEYAHYYGGDTTVGGWMARTEHRVNRVWQEMADGVGITALPFGLYARLVTSVLDGVRRRQEFAADRRAASAYGGAVLAEVLRAAPGWRLAFSEYVRRGAPRVEPGIGVLDGFVQFLESPDVRKLARFGVFREMEDTAPSGTHPPLRDRLRQLSAIPGPSQLDDRPATDVIRNFDGLEFRLFVHWSRGVQR